MSTLPSVLELLSAIASRGASDGTLEVQEMAPSAMEELEAQQQQHQQQQQHSAPAATAAEDEGGQQEHLEDEQQHEPGAEEQPEEGDGWGPPADGGDGQMEGVQGQEEHRQHGQIVAWADGPQVDADEYQVQGSSYAQGDEGEDEDDDMQLQHHHHHAAYAPWPEVELPRTLPVYVRSQTGEDYEAQWVNVPQVLADPKVHLAFEVEDLDGGLRRLSGKEYLQMAGLSRSDVRRSVRLGKRLTYMGQHFAQGTKLDKLVAACAATPVREDDPAQMRALARLRQQLEDVGYMFEPADWEIKVKSNGEGGSRVGAICWHGQPFNGMPAAVRAYKLVMTCMETGAFGGPAEGPPSPLGSVCVAVQKDGLTLQRAVWTNPHKVLGPGVGGVSPNFLACDDDSYTPVGGAAQQLLSGSALALRCGIRSHWDAYLNLAQHLSWQGLVFEPGSNVMWVVTTVRAAMEHRNKLEGSLPPPSTGGGAGGAEGYDMRTTKRRASSSSLFGANSPVFQVAPVRTTSDRLALAQLAPQPPEVAPGPPAPPAPPAPPGPPVKRARRATLPKTASDSVLAGRQSADAANFEAAATLQAASQAMLLLQPQLQEEPAQELQEGQQPQQEPQQDGEEPEGAEGEPPLQPTSATADKAAAHTKTEQPSPSPAKLHALGALPGAAAAQKLLLAPPPPGGPAAMRPQQSTGGSASADVLQVQQLAVAPLLAQVLPTLPVLHYTESGALSQRCRHQVVQAIIHLLHHLGHPGAVGQLFQRDEEFYSASERGQERLGAHYQELCYTVGSGDSEAVRGVLRHRFGLTLS